MGNICLVSRDCSQSHHIHIIYPVLLPFDEDVKVPKTKRILYCNHLLNLHNNYFFGAKLTMEYHSSIMIY